MGIVQDNSGTFTATGFSASLLAASDAANTVVLVICAEVTLSTPASWNLQTSQVNNMGHYWFDRPGVSLTSVTITTGGAGGGVWWMAEVEGVHNTSSGSNNIISSNTYSTPSITPTAGTRTIMAALGSLSPGFTSRTLSGWTNSFTEVDDTLLSANVWPMQGVAAREDITADGSTGYTTTGTYSSFDNDSRTALIAAYTGVVTSVTRVAVTTGAPASAAAFSPTLPTHASGDRLILSVVGKYETTTIPTIDQGWTLVGSGTGGTGSAANDTGQTFWAVYAKDAASGSETAPTVTPGGTAPNSWEWIAATHRPAAGKTWADSIGASVAWVTSASDTTTASPLTGTAGAWTGVQPTADDAIFAVGVIPTDLGTALGATTITATGLSGGTKTTATSQYVENALNADTAAVWAGWTDFTGTASAGLALSFTVTGATNQSGSLIAIALRQQAGGTNYTQTPTDDAGLTDSRIFDQTKNVTDSAGLVDSTAFDQTGTVTDSAGLTDTSSVQAAKFTTVDDSAGLTDTSVLARALVYTDSAGLVDSAVLDRSVAFTDSSGLTDSTSTSLTGAGVYTDSAGLTDTSLLARGLVYTDSSGLTDTSSIQAAKLIVVTDDAGLTDAGLGLTVADELTDSTGLTDTQALARSVVFLDSAGLTDSQSIVSAGATVITDSVGLTDSRVLDLSKTQTDSAGLTDTTAISSGKILDVTDSAGLTDSLTSSQAKSVTDDAGLTDTQAFAASKILTDLAGLTDTASIFGGRDVSVTDSAGLTDTRVISKGLEPTDSVGLTDSQAFAAAYRMTDSAGLVDTSIVDLQVPVVFGRGASRQGHAATGNTGRALVGSGRAGRG